MHNNMLSRTIQQALRHGRPSEKKVPKGQQPLEIHLFMSVDPSNEQLKTSLSI